MKLLKISNLCALLSSFLVASATVLEGYEDGVLSFVGTIGGFPIEANGTAQSIISQAQALHSSIQVPEASSLAIRNELVERGVSGRLCIPVAGQNWVMVYKEYINAGLSYLRSLSGKCSINARTCARIACSTSGAIYWCNDRNYWREGDCWYLANYAQDICNSCTIDLSGFQFDICGGQIFDSDGWNVIVKGEVC